MNNSNDSSVNDFLLLGFSILGKTPTLLFLIFSLTYGTILAFNITIMSVILLDRTLHCPMYFLLFALSVSETCTTFVTIPKLLMTLWTGRQSISLVGCATQMFCFFSLGANNCFLLVAMSYDRYAAICYPLQYQVLMEKRVCIKLVAASCVTGCFISLVICILIFRLPFCGPNRIQHFFCDISPVLSLTCIDTYLTNLGIVLLCALVLLGTVLLISISYFYIISAILRICSSLRRRKAFSTCASHLTVVITHFSCACFVYLRPKAASSLDQDTLISTVYVFLTPLLNPLIYTLRNKEVKLSIQKLIRNSFCSQNL
ncbi:olfactory receptor 10K1-like [Python bivittatus]|uniref:Olfactory receptor 10K1-like n=1 Tax=Python bivittatus TaxID=176946 RepID=A0A9F2WEF3_PYTBI|nr:olfactory receptor 10K1-like [Python bivittatus]XP_015745613.1 olfactory receptor 10K1-like [Python bivittatus]